MGAKHNEMPITPAVLKWAREWAHLTVQDVHKFPLGDWEAGKGSPTYPELESLAKKYRVPTAVFFFPEPPGVPPLRNSFRTLPDAQFESIPSGIWLLIRKARAFQISLEELNQGTNPAGQHILKELKCVDGLSAADVAGRVRDFLGVDVETQKNWTDIDKPFEKWRSAIGRHGVWVFKDGFRNDNYSGFCLYDAKFPVIYVNNSVKTREIFTLFHELGHLLFGTSGVTERGNNPDENSSESNRKTEILCNRFAAEFLLPDHDFNADHTGPPTEVEAARLAQLYSVSREVVFRRFLDLGLIGQGIYEAAADKWAKERKPAKAGKKKRGNSNNNTVAYLGTKYLHLAFSAYHQNRITESELADHLDVSIARLDILENLMMNKLLSDEHK